MSTESSPKSRKNVVRYRELGGSAHDDWRQGRVVTMAYARKEVVHALVVEPATEVGPNPAAVAEIGGGGQLRGGPAERHRASWVRLWESDSLDNVRYLEHERKQPTRHHIGDSPQARQLGHRSGRCTRGKDVHVCNISSLARPKKCYLGRRLAKQPYGTDTSRQERREV